jgi:hypothetical protein
MESNMNTVCSTERKSFPERINQASEIPQTETMVSISQLLDDKGQEISSAWKENLTNGTIAAVVVELEDGNQMFLQPISQAHKEVLVPSSAHFVRDEETQESIWRLSTVSGGSS